MANGAIRALGRKAPETVSIGDFTFLLSQEMVGQEIIMHSSAVPGFEVGNVTLNMILREI